jgi:glycosyltransferase involved in cell wall biosynthesis
VPKAKRLLCIIRDPFVDKIPSLRCLLSYFSENGWKIDLATVRDPAYPPPSFLNDRIRAHFVDVGPSGSPLKRRVPASVRLFWTGFRRAVTSRPDCVLGAGAMGIPVASALARIVRSLSVAFCVEYPADPHLCRKLTLPERLELVGIRTSRVVIVHDAVHADLISRMASAERKKFEMLPNGTRGEAGRKASNFLGERLGIPRDEVIILHAGGLGPYFQSLEVATAARSWPAHWHLIFHTSYRIGDNPYLLCIREAAKSSNVHFSTEPVSTDQLDMLVSSSRVGLAIYSIDRLGFRAEYLGLAAGKIGNYLKCGVPVVATDLPTVRDYLRQYECGITISRPSEVAQAVAQILKDYDRYSRNALRCFRDLWAPDPYCKRIAERMIGLTAGQRVGQ